MRTNHPSKYGRGLACGVLLTLPMVLSGCSALQAQSRVDPQTIAAYPLGEFDQQKGKGVGALRCPERLKGDSHSGAINLDCFKFPDDNKGEKAYNKAAGESDGKFRDRLASIMMKQSDDVCTLELGRLTANEATVNTVFSVLTTGLSATASIVSGDTAKSILSGLATTSNATRGHVNAEIYRNALSPVVSRAIQNERIGIRKSILEKFSTKNNLYSVDQMIFDVNGYHQACSFYYGLGLVVKAVDRTSFDMADRGRLISLSLEEIDVKLGTIRQSLRSVDKSEDEKLALTEQLKTLISLQTKLFSERSNLGNSSPEPVAETAPPAALPADGP